MQTRPLIAFDAMGVVYLDPDDVASCLVPFLAERGVKDRADEIKAAYREASLGKTSAREFWDRIGLGHLHPRIQEEYLSTRLRMDPLFPAAAARLKKRFSIAMLSNDLGEWSAYLRSRNAIDALFDIAVISGEAGVRKPDTAIYRRLLDLAGRKGRDCLMIDDRLANLEPALALGMRTILFKRDGLAAREWSMKDPDFRPDAEASSMEALPELIESLFA